MSDLNNGFPPLADPADVMPFEEEADAEDEEGPSEAVAATLQICRDVGMVSAEYLELALFCLAEVAGPLNDALSEGLEAEEPMDPFTAADIQAAVTRLQIAAETLAAVDLGGDEEYEEGAEGAEEDDLEAEAA